MIHRLKYRNARHLAQPLGTLLSDYLSTLGWTDVDVVVPVPLHANRLKERGYNQSLLLAEVIAKLANCPLLPDAVERVRDTPAQMRLPSADRQANVRGAFAATRRLPGARIILIDDVCTTTATMEACAHALRRAGAASVKGLALARARQMHEQP